MGQGVVDGAGEVSQRRCWSGAESRKVVMRRVGEGMGGDGR